MRRIKRRVIHALCHRTGAQIKRHRPLVHALSRTFMPLAVRHHVESGAPLNVNRDLCVGTVIEQGGLRDETPPEYRIAAIPPDITHANPQEALHIRIGRADRDGSAASTSGALKHKPLHTLVRDRCLLASVTITFSPLRWQALDTPERKVTNSSISWRQSSSQG